MKCFTLSCFALALLLPAFAEESAPATVELYTIDHVGEGTTVLADHLVLAP
jgi:hypothetical protein